MRNNSETDRNKYICTIQGQVTTLQMAFTYKKKSLKKSYQFLKCARAYLRQIQHDRIDFNNLHHTLITHHVGRIISQQKLRRFLAQHGVAMLEQCCNHWKQCRNSAATLCCAKNRRWESSRATSPGLCDLKNVSWDLRECYPPQPPLFDLYNSSDDTQPGPIIAKYLILLFHFVLDGNWWFRDRTRWG